MISRLKLWLHYDCLGSLREAGLKRSGLISPVEEISRRHTVESAAQLFLITLTLVYNLKGQSKNFNAPFGEEKSTK